MTKTTLLFLLGLLPFNSLFGQVPISQSRTFTCEKIAKANDFENAIDAHRTYKVSLACSPSGAGNIQEVRTSSKNSKYYFEKEHNIVWIKFQAIKTSKLAISITPNSKEDDYDFLLFKDEGESTKKRIQSKQLKPIRSNIARTKNIGNGSTGLKYNAERTHVSSGLQIGHSKFIEVEQNETYYLAIDNVYDNGEGAVIIFDYFKLTTIEGVIEDSESKAIKADIVWENSTTGEEIVTTTSDPSTGAFEMIVPFNMKPTNRYTLAAFSDDYFFSEVTYTPMEIAKREPTPIKMVLPELKAGKRTKLNNINFVGGQAVFLEGAYPTMKRLYKLMKKNPSLVIHIEGHTNGCNGGTQKLSEDRAKVSKEYLTSKGISADRITTEGLNCKFMLYPLTGSAEQQSLNRRIEVIVKDY